MKKNYSHKTTMKVVSTALIAALLLSCSGCGNSSNKSSDSNSQAEVTKDGTQYSKEGMTFYLPDSFTESKQEPYTFYFTSSNAICLGLKESKADITAAQLTISSLDDYAKVIMDNSGVTSEVTEYGDKTKYFIWDKKVNDTNYSYIGFVTETLDAFWLVQFACLKEEFDKNKDNFFDYYDSVSIADSTDPANTSSTDTGAVTTTTDPAADANPADTGSTNTGAVEPGTATEQPAAE